MKPKSACRGLVILPILTFATSATSGGHESFLLAETLKHSTFSQDHPIRSTSKTTVLTTEAHPPTPHLVVTAR
jgi:hypothetical protein